MSKALPNFVAATAPDGTEDVLLNQGGNPRRALAMAAAHPTFGWALNLMNFIPSTEWSAIAALTSTHDCYSALVAAIAALPVQGGTIVVPPGLFNMSATLNLKKTIHLLGAGGGEAGAEISRLVWPANTTGIVVHRPNTDASGVVPSTTGADGSIFEGLFIGSTLSGSTSGHGFHLRARATIKECRVQNFALDGIHIQASVGGDDTWMGNANNWYADHCRLSFMGRHGLYTVGSDVNAGTAVAVSADECGGIGIYDGSFLGNTYVGCHTENNIEGQYKSDNANARNLFLGCYSEATPYGSSSIMEPATVVSGLHAAGFTPDSTARIIAAGPDGADTPVPVTYPLGSSTFRTSLGPGAGLDMQLDSDGGVQIGMYDTATGTYDDKYGRSSGAFFKRTTSRTTTRDENGVALPAGNLVLPATSYIDQGNGQDCHSFRPFWGASAPTGGTALGGAWLKGDIVWNVSPTAAGGASPFVGWVCTVAGNPATWKTFGPISA